jgi:hypothetical protein
MYYTALLAQYCIMIKKSLLEAFVPLKKPCTPEAKYISEEARRKKTAARNRFLELQEAEKEAKLRKEAGLPVGAPW